MLHRMLNGWSTYIYYRSVFIERNRIIAVQFDITHQVY